MSNNVNIVCDVCGAVKRDVNHWWTVVEATERRGKAYLKVGHSGDFPLSGGKDVCGQSHLHTLVDRWMETGQLEKAEVNHPKEEIDGED